jgi:uncharacterized protein
MNYYNSDISARPIQSSLDLPVLMRQVYAWMFFGLLVTAGVAVYVGTQTELVSSIFRNPMTLILLVVLQIGLVLFLSARIMHMNPTTAAILFLVYSATIGITVSTIFVRYNFTTIFAAFGVTAATFGVVSLCAYTTKLDLSRLGSILIVAFIGLLIATAVNMFIARSDTLFWIINYAGVLIFVGLIAYDTQNIKNMAMNLEMMNGGANQYMPDGSMVRADGVKDTLTQRMAIIGALTLYMSFVNLFLFILRIMGASRD